MHDDVELLDDGERANLRVHARSLYQEPAYRQAVIDLRTKIYDDWCKTKPEDAAERELLYHDQRALARVDGRLRALMGSVEERLVRGNSA